MGHSSPGFGSGQSGPARVGKEIQYPDRPPGCADALPKPVPVRSLFRKQPGVLEAERF